jgi:DNA repair protein RadC
MSRIQEMEASERPRERLWAKGASALKVAELLAILLRTGMKGKSALALAEELLLEHKDLAGLSRVEAAALARHKGIGRTKAIQLKAAFEMGVRLAGSLAAETPLETPRQVEQLLGPEMRPLAYESLRVLCLNTKMRLTAAAEISRGTINETVAHPRDVLQIALLHRSHAFLLVHNHPSGDPAPSSADLDFTRRIRDAADLMEIQLVDHVILGAPTAARAGYYSFKEAGYL